MSFWDFLVFVIYAVSVPIFYKRGYRKGIVDGLDKILKEMDQ